MEYPTDTGYLFLVPYDSLLMDCYVTYLLSTPSQSNISQIKTDITAYLPESSAEVRDVVPVRHQMHTSKIETHRLPQSKHSNNPADLQYIRSATELKTDIALSTFLSLKTLPF